MRPMLYAVILVVCVAMEEVTGPGLATSDNWAETKSCRLDDYREFLRASEQHVDHNIIDMALPEVNDSLGNSANTSSEQDVFKINANLCSIRGTYNYGFIEIRGTRGTVEIRSQGLKRGTRVHCSGRIYTSEGHVLKISVQDRPFNCKQMYIHIAPLLSSAGSLVRVWNQLRCFDEKSSIVYTPGNVAYFFVHAFVPATMNSPWFTLQFQSSPTEFRGRVTVPVTYTSPSSGFVMSSEDGRPYSCRMSASSVLPVPTDKLLMISFVHLDINTGSCAQTIDCLNPYFAIYNSANNRTETVMSKCSSGPFRLFPRIYNASVEFYFFSPSMDTLGGPASEWGVKIMFDIYPSDAAPSILPGGMLNCSTGQYDLYKHHVHCDFQKDCYGGEDERACPYSHPACNDSLVYRDSCYVVVVTKPPRRDWKFARDDCETRGGGLVSFNTKSEEKALKVIYDIINLPFYVGLQSVTDAVVPPMQRRLWRWLDGSVAYNSHITTSSLAQLSLKGRRNPLCASFSPITGLAVSKRGCLYSGAYFARIYICEIKPPELSAYARREPLPPLSAPSLSFSAAVNMTMLRCDNGAFIHDFLFCEFGKECESSATGSGSADRDHTPQSLPYPALCHVPERGTTRMFECETKEQRVHYTLVCDYRKDCADGSDESFCQHRQDCMQRLCLNSQCIKESQWCDGTLHCSDDSDETFCSVENKDEYAYEKHVPTTTPPALVKFLQDGRITFRKLQSPDSCPETHFQCPEGYCLPVYVRCNGVYDCPHHEDEAGCVEYTCPGFYRCHGSPVCVHPRQVCDGKASCPQQDDEWRCGRVAPCPAGCHCQGLALLCTAPFPTAAHPHLRYLDAGQSGLTPADVSGHVYLVELHLPACGLTSVTTLSLPNLRVLDLSHNHLDTVSWDVFSQAANLHTLLLAGNPLATIDTPSTDFTHQNLHTLDLSSTRLTFFHSVLLSNFEKVSKLNLSHTPIDRLGGSGFTYFPNLKEVDLRHCPMRDIPANLFGGVHHLQRIYAQNFKICCSANLPVYFDEKRCLAPEDEVSTCADLLRSGVYRTFLWIFCFLALVGNAGCFLFRVMWKVKESKAGFHVFVASLSVADSLMGIYLALVGVADQVYRDRYLWFEHSWKASAACKVAGFLALVSSEVSAFIICLITLDRFIVLTFPFSRLRFKAASSGLACGGAWVLGVGLGLAPLLPPVSRWRLYEQSSICIPLPFATGHSAGRHFAFAVMIVLNFILFLLVAVGQAAIYRSVQTNLMATINTNITKKPHDTTVARRLFSVAVSNFVCWFPIGLLGLMAARGFPVPGEVNVVVAIMVLPLNSALNPFLYTFNTVVERRRKAEERRLMSWLQENAPSVTSERRDVETQGEEKEPLEDAFVCLQRRLASGEIVYCEIITFVSDADCK